jgi:hypothetical protein
LSPRDLRLTAVLATAVAVLAPAVVDAAPSQAYKLGGTKWPTRTITYHSATPEFDGAIAAAVRAWNTSGVRVRFKPASRRRARLKIIHGKNLGLGANGLGTRGYAAPDVVVRRTIEGVPISGFPIPCGARVRGPSGKPARVRCVRGPHVWLERVGAKAARDPRVVNVMTRTVVHELGHVLGLDHVRNRCAVMSADGIGRCAQPEPWQVRCRMLEADDVRGAIARYGGALEPLAPEFCDVAGPPVPPVGLAATFDAGSRVIAFTWTNAQGSSVNSVATAVERDACAAEPPPYRYEAAPGTPGSDHSAVDDAGGRYCVSAWSADEFGRLSAAATIWIDVPPAESEAQHPMEPQL